MAKTILVTGGAGFIGSHTCVALAQAGYDLVVIDNLSNSDAQALGRVQRIAGARPVRFWQGDVRDPDLLAAIFDAGPVDAVMHFAGLKSVSESVARPAEYYDCNVQGSLALLAAMERACVHKLIFSSSATVYGEPEASPVRENAPTRPCSPYGRSKLIVEQVLTDLARSDARWRMASLRYFNPVGAHPSGLLGERTSGAPNNLMPTLCKVASDPQACLTVHGADYPTSDGTCVRDYVHVMDIADGHVAALHYLSEMKGAFTFNLGAGQGTSVFELVAAFGRAAGVDLRYLVGPRRPGDVAAYWADVEHAHAALGWTSKRSVQQMCDDAWRWQCHTARQPDRASGKCLVE